jgi:hypothetical protein
MKDLIGYKGKSYLFFSSPSKPNRIEQSRITNTSYLQLLFHHEVLSRRYSFPCPRHRRCAVLLGEDQG